MEREELSRQDIHLEAADLDSRGHRERIEGTPAKGKNQGWLKMGLPGIIPDADQE
ncbi:MAG: hypothetical protein ACK6AD_00500 [Cyanobacteriota bacterium]